MKALPRDTQASVSQNLAQCQNLGLMLNKFQPWDEVGGQWDLTFQLERQQQGQWQSQSPARGGAAKGHWLAVQPPGDVRTKRTTPTLDPNKRLNADLLKAYRARWESLVKDGAGQIHQVVAHSRIVIGLGGKGTLEMGLTLHPIYGFPIIPASALKGLARAAALYRLAEAWGVPALGYDDFLARKEDKDKTPLNRLEALLEAPEGKPNDPDRDKQLIDCLRALRNDIRRVAPDAELLKMDDDDVLKIELFRNVREALGTVGFAGKAVFYDAIPAVAPVFVTEMMNPHFPKYYSGNEFPHDAQDPQPVAFLALEKGAQFLCAVGSRRGNAEVAERGWAFLKYGLREYGIGGKTSSGFGIFREKQAH